MESSKQSELASEITKMIDKIQDMRIKTLKAESKTSEMTERHQHLEKLLDIKKKEIAVLEEKYAKIERDLAVREQNWRERDSERIKKFFQAKLKEEEQQRAIGDHRRGVRPAASQGASGQPVEGLLDSSRPKTAAETVRDEEIARLQEQCAKLQDRCNVLESQNALLNNFSEQNLKIMGDTQQ